MLEEKLNHLAIIMDGNGRWAQKRNLPINEGHREGAKTLEKTIDSCLKFNIKSLTVYAFSTENWKRSKEEIDEIFSLLKKYLNRNLDSYNDKNIRVKVIGNLFKVEQNIVNDIKKIEKKTENNNGFYFDIAFCYGGRNEIIDACKTIVNEIKNNKLDVENINELNFRNYLYDSKINDPDLIIRTGGDFRMSNFLLWEMSYSELYFTNILWPDFDEEALSNAINDFKQRKRTFGDRKAKR